jgi:hypothetical protein
MFLVNAFSFNMVSDDVLSVRRAKVTADEVRGFRMAPGLISAVGHATTAGLLTDILGFPVETNRTTVTLRRGDSCLLAQYVGPRLPEGATTLPEGARIDFYLLHMD